MKKLLLAVWIILWLGLLFGVVHPALAQGCGPTNPNCTVPDRPFGDSTNATANTRFVSQSGSGPYTPSGLDPTGATDNASIISAAFAVNSWVQLPCGNFKISTFTISISNARFSGSGECTRLRPGSASLSPVLIGGGITAPLNFIMEDITIWPLQQMTGGCAILAKGIARARFNRVFIGTPEDQQANGSWFNNGLCLQGFDLVSFTGGQIVGGTGEGIQLSQSVTFTYGVAFYLDASTFMATWGSNCVHLGGGAGGVNLDSQATQACGGWVVRVDKTLFSATNNQLFLGPNFAGEAGTSGGVLIDTAAMMGGTFHCVGCWIAGNTGSGVKINSGNLLTAKFVGAHIVGNGSHGIHTLDGGILAVNAGSEIVANGTSVAAHGIFIDAVGATAQINISGALVLNNGVGGSGWGILQSGTAPLNIVIDGTTITGNSQGPLSGISAGTQATVTNNMGYNPVGVSGPTTVGASPATICASTSPETHYFLQSATNTATVKLSSTVIGTMSSATLPVTVDLGPLECEVITWATTAPTYMKSVH